MYVQYDQVFYQKNKQQTESLLAVLKMCFCLALSLSCKCKINTVFQSIKDLILVEFFLLPRDLILKTIHEGQTNHH